MNINELLAQSRRHDQQGNFAEADQCLLRAIYAQVAPAGAPVKNPNVPSWLQGKKLGFENSTRFNNTPESRLQGLQNVKMPNVNNPKTMGIDKRKQIEAMRSLQLMEQRIPALINQALAGGEVSGGNSELYNSIQAYWQSLYKASLEIKKLATSEMNAANWVNPSLADTKGIRSEYISKQTGLSPLDQIGTEYEISPEQEQAIIPKQFHQTEGETLPVPRTMLDEPGKVVALGQEFYDKQLQSWINAFKSGNFNELLTLDRQIQLPPGSTGKFSDISSPFTTQYKEFKNAAEAKALGITGTEKGLAVQNADGTYRVATEADIRKTAEEALPRIVNGLLVGTKDRISEEDLYQMPYMGTNQAPLSNANLLAGRPYMNVNTPWQNPYGLKALRELFMFGLNAYKAQLRKDHPGITLDSQDAIDEYNVMIAEAGTFLQQKSDRKGGTNNALVEILKDALIAITMKSAEEIDKSLLLALVTGQGLATALSAITRRNRRTPAATATPTP